MKKRLLFIVVIMIAAISLWAQSTTRYVDDDNVCGGYGPCYTTIQAAIDASSNGDVIKVYPGTYNQDEANGYDPVTGGPGPSDFNIFVHKSVTIQGVNSSGVPITDYDDVEAFVIPKRNTPSGNLSTFFIQADNVVITGLDVTAYADPAYNYKTISVIGNNATIQYCKLHNLDQVSSIYVYDPRYNAGTNTSYLQSYTFSNNYLDAGGIYASGIRFSSGAGWTGSVSNRIISGNSIHDGSYGIEFVGPQADPWDYYPVGGATITSNSFAGQDKGSVVGWGEYLGAEGYGPLDWDAIFSGNTFDKAVLTKTSGGAVRYYDYFYNDGSDHYFYYIRGIYSGIQRYPINRVAQAGDILNVAAGTYTETGQIVIDKDLSIVGANKTTTIIKPDQNTTGDWLDDPSAWILVNSGITFNLSNVTLDGTGKLICNGIISHGSGTINNNIIKNIKFNESGPDYSGAGIALFESTMTISNNQFSEIGREGIFAKGAATSATIDGNTYTGKGAGNWLDYGIELSTGATAIISNNTISGNIGVATVDNSTSSGILVSTYYGAGTTATITNCTLTNNYEGLTVGYNSSDLSQVVANHNTISGNTYFGIANYGTTNTVNAENNYWGSLDYSVISGKVSGNVDFEPWCNSNFTVCTFTYNPNLVYNQTDNTYFSSLQAALDAASPNDVIQITDDVAIGGVTYNGTGSVTVVNNSGGIVTIYGASPALTVNSGTVTYTGFNFATTTNDPTILITGGKLILRNCTVTESTGFTQSCIELSGAGQLDAGVYGDHGTNTFVPGDGKGITNNSSGTVTAVGNYWGSTVAATVNGLMTGSGTTIYDPWCNNTFTICNFSNAAGPVTYAGKVVSLTVGDVVKVPVTVKYFNTVDAVSLKIQYDPLIIRFDSAHMPNAFDALLDSSAIGGYITISSFKAGGVTLGPDAELIHLCFTRLTPGTSMLNFIDNGVSCEYQNYTTQVPYWDTPLADYYKYGFVTDMSLEFTRTYLPSPQTITVVPAGGSSPYTYDWDGPAGFTGDGTNTITPLPTAYGRYSVTVTDNLGASVSGWYYFGPVHNTNTKFDFATIQRAIDTANTVNGNTILCDPITFKENPVVSKSLTINGANFDQDARSTRPYAESIVQTNGNQTAVFTVGVNNVTINGFTIEGNDPLVTGANVYCGEDANVYYDVLINGPQNNVSVKNNVLKHAAIGCYTDAGLTYTICTGNVIDQNWFDAIGVYDYGYAITLRRNFYADITNNKMTRVYCGVHINDFYGVGGPGSWLLTGNEIHSYAAGTWYQQQYNQATPLTIDNNDFIVEALLPVTNSYGLQVNTMQDAVHPVITNNTITGTNYGLVLWNNTTSDPIALDNTNTISGTTVAGIIMTNNLSFNPVGTTVFGEGGASTVILKGIQVTPASGIGVDIDASATVLPTTQTLSITAPTILTGGSTGLLINGSYTAITGNNINNLSFAGQTGNYITLSNSALTGQQIVATNSLFGGLKGSTATNAQNFAIEDKIFHKLDNGSLGLIRVKAGQLFVTQNSGSVQRGIDAADPLDIIWVGTGIFNENPLINKDLDLRGIYYNNPRCDREPDESTISGFGPVVTIAANGVSFNGFYVSGYTGIYDNSYEDVNISNNLMEFWGYGIYISNLSLDGSNGLTVNNNCINVYQKFFWGNQTFGIFLGGITGTAAAVVTNNTIKHPFYGYMVYNVGTSSARPTISGGTITGVMQGVSVVNVNPASPTTFAPSYLNLDNIDVYDFNGDLPSLPDFNFHAGVYVFTGGSDLNPVTMNIHDVNVNGTGKIASDCAGMVFGDFSTASGTMQNITINACTIEDNLNRGVSVRGDHALVNVNNCTLDNNGFDSFGPENAGFGISSSSGATVNVNNCFITNPLTSTYTASALITFTWGTGGGTIIATENSLNRNGNGWLANNSGGTLTATCNWWGSDYAGDVLSYATGTVDQTPFLTYGTETGPGATLPGFQPAANCTGEKVKVYTDNAMTDLVASYTTIQKAVNGSLAGYYVKADPGTYAEQVVINKQLFVRGANYGLTPNVIPSVRTTESVIDGGGGGGAIPVLITASGVQLNGFTVQNSGTTGVEGGIALQGVTGCNVQKNIVTDNFAGIALMGSPTNTIDDNNLTANYYGVYLGNGTTPSTGNTVSANDISGTIAVYVPAINGFTGDGVYADQDCNGNIFTGNKSHNNGQNGFFIWNANGQDLNGNQIYNNTKYGVEMFGSSGNTIHLNNAITGNANGITIRYNDPSYPSTGNVIENNNISGNTNYGVYAEPEVASVDAAPNWWGDATGPYNNPLNLCGLGNDVTANVTFSPWYYQAGMSTLNGLPNLTPSAIADISTITATPIIAATTITYPPLAGYDPAVLTDAVISTTAGNFPAGTKVIEAVYNDHVNPVVTFTLSFDLSLGNSFYLSEILGNPSPYGTPLFAHSGLSVDWQFTIEGATSPIANLPVSIQSVSYLDRAGCNNTLGTPESFNLTFANAVQDLTGTYTVCATDPLVVISTTDFPTINVDDRVKSDALITTDNDFNENAQVAITYNGNPYGTYTVPAGGKSSLYVSEMLGGSPNPLASESGELDETWTFSITGLDYGVYNITVTPVARLTQTEPDTYTDYPYDLDNATLTKLNCGFSGVVKYYNNSNTVMDNVQVELWQGGVKKYPVTGTIATSGTGNYSFSDVASGIYSVKFVTGKTPGGINSTDAAQTNYWFTGPYTIEKARFIAGDVSGEGSISAYDASRIQGYFVSGVPFSRDPFSFWRAGETINVNPGPNNTVYTEVSVGISTPVMTNINFWAMATGDFNRSFIPGAGKAGSDNLELIYTDNLLVNTGAEFELPIYTVTPVFVGAASMILYLPSDMVEVTGVTTSYGGMLDWAVQDNILRIGWNTPDPVNLDAGEILLTLQLKSSSQFITGNEIRITLANSDLNELADQNYEPIPGAVLGIATAEASTFGIIEPPAAEQVSLSTRPNPFKDYTMLTWELPFEGRVTLDVYDIVGTKVASLLNMQQDQGSHTYEYHTSALPSGVYFVTLKLQGDNQTLVRTIKIVRNR